MGKQEIPSPAETPQPSPEVVFTTNDFLVLTGRANPGLACAVGNLLNKKALKTASSFADRETRIQIPENVRKRNVFIIQPTSPPTDKHIMELLFMIDAADRASAGEITAVIPYFGYSRQDRKERPRVPISAALVAGLIKYVGARRILTFDIHSEQQEGYVRGPWDNLYASYVLIPAIKAWNLTNLKVVSPDKGGVVRAKAYADRLNAAGTATVYKERDTKTENTSKVLFLEGNVLGCDVVIVDDIIDTAGSITDAAKLLMEHGANKVLVAATHGLFSEPALKRIDGSPIDEILITDTVQPRPKVAHHPKIKIVSVAPMLAEAIRRIHTGESLSALIL